MAPPPTKKKVINPHNIVDQKTLYKLILFPILSIIQKGLHNDLFHFI